MVPWPRSRWRRRTLPPRRGRRRPPSPNLLLLRLWIAIALFLTCFLYLLLSGFFYSPFVHPTPLQPLPWLRSVGHDNFYSLCPNPNPNPNVTSHNPTPDPDSDSINPLANINGSKSTSNPIPIKSDHVFDGSSVPKPNDSSHIPISDWNRNSSKSIDEIKQFFLVAVIFNRVFGRDQFGIAPYECRQWIEYMVYSGVEHIFWYDTAHNNAESQEPYLVSHSSGGILTYLRFHRIFPDSVTKGFHFEQDNAYTHFLATFKSRTKWAIQIDVDEYPFSPMDKESCFLQRFIREYERNNPNVTQILLQCMIFAGNPSGDLTHGWVIERYQRRKYETEGLVKGYESRQKPIYRADLCKGIIKENPHIIRMEDGNTIVADDVKIRLNHYWGARELGFTSDTSESNGMLVNDDSIQYIASHIKQETGLRKREKDVLGTFLRMVACW